MDNPHRDRSSEEDLWPPDLVPDAADSGSVPAAEATVIPRPRAEAPTASPWSLPPQRSTAPPPVPDDRPAGANETELTVWLPAAREWPLTTPEPDTELADELPQRVRPAPPADVPDPYRRLSQLTRATQPSPAPPTADQAAPSYVMPPSVGNPDAAPLPALPALAPPSARPPMAPPEATAVPPVTVRVPTADDFARRRAARPADPLATMGPRAALRRATLGLVKLGPSDREQEHRRYVEMVRRNFGGLRQVTVVNPKGGAGKTVAVLLLAMTFGQRRGGYVLAWDNNETQGTLGMRAQQDFHSRTVRDLLRDLGQFAGAQGRVGDLSQYVRAQGEGMFDVLASDESATAGEMLTAHAFGELREVVSRFYKLICVDTGNNVRAENWQAAIDATDQLVVTMSARNDSAEPAARMLDHLEQTGRERLVRQAVTVVSMPPNRTDLDLAGIQQHFAARTRAVLLAPYEKLVDSGEPVRYAQLSGASKDAWLRIAAAVAEGL